MTRKLLILLAILGLAPAAFAGDDSPKTMTLAARYDLDGAAASATLIVNAQLITDGLTFTLSGQPDVPRPIAVVLTDADVSIVGGCVLTITGKVSSGETVTATTTLGGGSGTKALSPSTYNWKSITSVVVNTCTGEGAGDTLSVGTTATIPSQYFKFYGRRMFLGQPYSTTLSGISAIGYRYDDTWVNPPPIRFTTTTPCAGVSCAATAVVASSGPFTEVPDGSLLRFPVDGLTREVLFTKTDANSGTITPGINLPAAGARFSFKTFFTGVEENDGVFNVDGYDAGTFLFIYTQLGNDVKQRVECRVGDTVIPSAWKLVDNTAQASTATQVINVVTVDFRLNGYTECRAGMEWAASDTDGDAGAELEIITVMFMGRLAPPLR